MTTRPVSGDDRRGKQLLELGQWQWERATVHGHGHWPCLIGNSDTEFPRTSSPSAKSPSLLAMIANIESGGNDDLDDIRADDVRNGSDGDPGGRSTRPQGSVP